MKRIRSFFIFFILLTLAGCTRQEKNAQTLSNSNADITSENNSNTINARSENNTGKNFSDISILLKPEETKDVTDIVKFIKEYVDENYYGLYFNIGSISFHQNQSAEKELHLGDLRMFTNLRYLSVSANVTSIDTDGLPDTLETLILTNNKISSFNAAALPPKLGVLRLNKNNISSFSVENYSKNLGVLDLSCNNLSSIDVGSLPQTLHHLFLSRNNISSFDIASLPKSVNSLDLMYNPIEEYFSIPGVSIQILNRPYIPVEIPREDIDFKEIFRNNIRFPDGYSEEQKEKFVEEMVKSYLSSLKHYESMYGTLDTEEILNGIAYFLE